MNLDFKPKKDKELINELDIRVKGKIIFYF